MIGNDLASNVLRPTFRRRRPSTVHTVKLRVTAGPAILTLAADSGEHEPFRLELFRRNTRQTYEVRSEVKLGITVKGGRRDRLQILETIYPGAVDVR